MKLEDAYHDRYQLKDDLTINCEVKRNTVNKSSDTEAEVNGA
jgi:hypothetical protein